MVRPSNIVEVKPEVVDLEGDDEKSRARSAEEVAKELEEAKRRRMEMAQQMLIQSLLRVFFGFRGCYGCAEALRGMMTTIGGRSPAIRTDSVRFSVICCQNRSSRLKADR